MTTSTTTTMTDWGAESPARNRLQKLPRSVTKVFPRAEERRRKEAAAAKARQAQMLTESQKYRALIQERLKRSWYPPASATRQMSVTLQITLLPTGELVKVDVVSRSGNSAFDNSAVSAARDVGRYPVPDDQQVFEEYFRRFSIEFNPENLK